MIRVCGETSKALMKGISFNFDLKIEIKSKNINAALIKSFYIILDNKLRNLSKEYFFKILLIKF